MKTDEDPYRDEIERAYVAFAKRIDNLLIGHGAKPIGRGEYALRTPVGALRIMVDDAVITCRFASPYGGRLVVTEGYDANAEEWRHGLPYRSDLGSWVDTTVNDFARKLDRVLRCRPNEVQRGNIEHDLARGCREAAKLAAFYVTCEKYKLLDAMTPNELPAPTTRKPAPAQPRKPRKSAAKTSRPKRRGRV